MKKIKTFRWIAYIVFIIMFVSLTHATVRATELPICHDVDANIDVEVNCKIEIQNTYFDNMESAHINIDVPQDVTLTVTDTDWACTSVVNGISCDKTYSTYFPQNTSKYVDVVFSANKAGKYNMKSTVSGIGTNTVDILYNNNVDIPYNIEWCGDGECNEEYEDPDSCPEDCAVCGDGECNGDEDGDSCPEDCAMCGDGECNGDEDEEFCPEDCGGSCGDGVCDWGGTEDCSCMEDCWQFCS